LIIANTKKIYKDGLVKMNKHSKTYRIGYAIGKQIGMALLAALVVFIPYIIYISYFK